MPYLVVMDGPQKGRRFAITESPIRIGRVTGNQIVLDSASVSSNHAEITKNAEGFLLRDLGSTNGTRVNGQRVTELQLYRDDAILLGDLPVSFGGDDAPVRRDAIPQPAASKPSATGEIPATVSRASVVVASSASGKHASASVPRDFKRRRDARLLWVSIILLLLVGVAFASWKFYHALFGHG